MNEHQLEVMKDQLELATILLDSLESSWQNLNAKGGPEDYSISDIIAVLEKALDGDTRRKAKRVKELEAQLESVNTNIFHLLERRTDILEELGINVTPR